MSLFEIFQVDTLDEVGEAGDPELIVDDEELTEREHRLVEELVSSRLELAHLVEYGLECARHDEIVRRRFRLARRVVAVVVERTKALYDS